MPNVAHTIVAMTQTAANVGSERKGTEPMPSCASVEFTMPCGESMADHRKPMMRALMMCG